MNLIMKKRNTITIQRTSVLNAVRVRRSYTTADKIYKTIVVANLRDKPETESSGGGDIANIEHYSIWRRANFVPGTSQIGQFKYINVREHKQTA